MKKIVSISLLMLFGMVMAQNSYNFSYRLDYTFPKAEGLSTDMIFAKHYIPAKFSEKTQNSLINFPTYMSGKSEYSFLSGNQMISIQNLDLENNFVITDLEYYGYGKTVEALYDKVELRKIERTSLTILGKSCNHYEVIATLDNEQKPSDFVLCIDETNEIDNVSFLLPKQEGKQIKGLVLAVTSPEGSENERIILTSISPVNSTIHFNLEKELAAQKVRQDSIDKLYAEEGNWAADSTAVAADPYYDSYYENYMTQPKFCDYSELYNLEFEDENAFSFGSSYIGTLCNYTYSMKRGEEEKYKNYALKEIKGIKKNAVKAGFIGKKDAQMFYEFLKKDIEAMKVTKPLTAAELSAQAAVDAANAAVEAVAYADEYDYSMDVYVPEYQSVYKPMKPEDSNFAVTSLSDTSGYWKGIPTYCKKISTVIPKFSDGELTKHATNYAGQICDMYLGEFEGSGVWYKGTLDAIRSEQMYFNNNRDKFSKKDKELLDEFLNNLD